MPSRLQHPARIVPAAFASVIAIGTGLLMLPVATSDGESASPLTALFTATSATCVTGLAVVDIGTYWSTFGQVIILLLIQAGGLGIMTLATLLALLVARGGVGFQNRLIAQAETRTLSLGEVPGVLRRIVVTVLVFEVAAAISLFFAFWIRYDMAAGDAAWHAIFHALSAFNNAGVSLNSSNLTDYVSDAWVTLTIAGAMLAGSLGFPVLIELWRRWRSPAKWTLHTKLTMLGTVVLIVVGFLLVLGMEWSNVATFGTFSTSDKLLAALFQTISPRTSGFNTVDIGAFQPDTLLVTDVLMFIGGGSAGTAGGIKVTTFFLLGFVIWAEVRGEPDVSVFRRRIDSNTQRQALTIALLGVGLVVAATLIILKMTRFDLNQVLFEVISAFSTTGLSTGITASLPGAAQLILVVLMFIGRVGTVTVASALALRSRKRQFRYPEERPIVG